MSRGSTDCTQPRVSTLRCALVWLLATAATTTTWWLVAPTAAALASAAQPGTELDELLVRVCAAALLPSSARLWLVTTVTVHEVVRGRPRGGGTARRWILLACGAALAAGSATPAVAHGGSGASGFASAEPDHRVTGHRVPGHRVIGGLALPDRAVAAPAPVAGDAHVVVRPGDSLWSIAASHPSGEPVDARWRAIWAANRAVVGDDPDLILPGQRLDLPPTDDDRTPR